MRTACLCALAPAPVQPAACQPLLHSLFPESRQGSPAIHFSLPRQHPIKPRDAPVLMRRNHDGAVCRDRRLADQGVGLAPCASQPCHRLGLQTGRAAVRQWKW